VKGYLADLRRPSNHLSSDLRWLCRPTER
jgi:hypothetical protein